MMSRASVFGERHWLLSMASVRDADEGASLATSANETSETIGGHQEARPASGDVQETETDAGAAGHAAVGAGSADAPASAAHAAVGAGSADAPASAAHAAVGAGSLPAVGTEEHFVGQGVLTEVAQIQARRQQRRNDRVLSSQIQAQEYAAAAADVVVPAGKRLRRAMVAVQESICR